MHNVTFVGSGVHGYSPFSSIVAVPLKIRPRAELARQAAAEGRAIEAYAAILLEQAAHVAQEQPLRRTGQDLIDASAKVRGVLTDEEIDTLFSRKPSLARPVNFE